MKSNTKIVSVLALLGVFAVACLWIWGEGSNFAEIEPDDNAVSVDRIRAGDPESGLASASRVAVVADAQVPANTTPARVSVVHGRLLDYLGRPLPNVTVKLCAFDFQANRIGEPLPGTVRSDASGVFELDKTAGQVVAPVAGAGYCTLRTSPTSGREDQVITVVAAPAIALAGRVLDTGGQPLVGVRVHVLTLLMAGFPLPLPGAVDVLRSSAVKTTDGGRFELPSAPLVPGVDYLFTLGGYKAKRIPSMEGSSGYLEVSLEKLTHASGTITGFVHDAAGRAVAGADLRLGHDQRTKSAADGAFEFEIRKPSTFLIATLPGFLPVLRKGIGKDTPIPLLLGFGRPALSITGRVVTSDGTGMSGILLNVLDPERTDLRIPIEQLSSPVQQDLPEGALGSTDSEGRFAIAGLLDRNYRLRAWDPKTALSVHSEPIRAGSSNVLLRVPAAPFLDELRGIVVDAAGQPIAGATVAAYLLVSAMEHFVTARIPSTSTDDDGRFTLKHVPRRHVAVTVSGEGLVYTKRSIEDCVATSPVRFEVLRLCHVQVKGKVGPVVRFLDAKGKALFCEVKSRTTAFSTNAWRMRHATSPVLQVPETAVTMTWSKDDKELGRKTIVLVPATPGANRVQSLFIGP